MSSTLAVNLDNLLHARTVESERIEFKSTWDPVTTGKQVLKTICAFANDFHHLNGGYLVIGVAERDGRAILPPVGLSDRQLEDAQKWIRGHCNRIDPEILPIMAPQVVEGRNLLVLQVPASEARPHRAPEGSGRARRYWIRSGNETVDAEANGQLKALLELTARVPFDDRRAHGATLEDIREALVREHLKSTESALLKEPKAIEIYRRMGLTRPANDHDIPRNVSLLLFSDRPADWFRGATIEVARFRDETRAEVLDEREFSGPLTAQLQDCLRWLEGLSLTHITKQQHRPEARRWVGFPIPALREALTNAVYHRSYDADVVEPTKVYLYADRIEITSYPGPVPGIEPEHLKAGARVPDVPARNRRIGEFLKERGFAERRLTGLTRIRNAMEFNGSPPPEFRFDPERTYFQVTLPAHPEFAAISAMEDAAYARAIGNRGAAFDRIESAWRARPGSATLAAELIRLLGERGEVRRAEEVHDVFSSDEDRLGTHQVTNALLRVLVDRTGDDGENGHKAKALLKRLDSSAGGQEAVESAILAKRLGELQAAHRYFEKAGEAVLVDPRALHEFAQTKIALSQPVQRKKGPEWKTARRRLLLDAREFLERVTQMEAPEARHGWAWRDLGRIAGYLQQPAERDRAYRRAIELLPEEARFTREWEEARRQRRRTDRRD